MPIQLDNAQYNAFVSFALGANDENAIAHAGAAPADPLAGRTISAGTGAMPAVRELAAEL